MLSFEKRPRRVSPIANRFFRWLGTISIRIRRNSEMVAASGPDVRATLASFYAARGRAEDALRVWDTLTDEQKAPHEAIARSIAQGLHDRKFIVRPSNLPGRLGSTQMRSSRRLPTAASRNLSDLRRKPGSAGE